MTSPADIERVADVRRAARATAPLVEVFVSIQGEGRHVGRPMAFVRVATCPIRCAYCDTPNSYRAPRVAEFRRGSSTVAGPRLCDRLSNPVDAAVVARWLDEHVAPDVAVSWTGGEPLVFPEFGRALGAAVRQQGRPFHVETAAHDAEALRRVLPVVDHLSADYKLPGTMVRGDPRAAARDCLDAARTFDCSIDVKLVLTGDVTDEVLAGAWSELRPWRDRIQLILQPVTPVASPDGSETVVAPFPMARTTKALESAQRAGFDARVLPQLHPVLGIE